MLGSDGITGFATPLATLHAFQGWADKFLATPAAGIEDRYVRFNYPFGKRGAFTTIAATAVYHDYTADVGGAQFGDELNLQLVARTERMALTAKYADYRADDLVHGHREVLVVGRLRFLSRLALCVLVGIGCAAEGVL